MSEKCEFYRDGLCGLDGDERCEVDGEWQDCEWGMPADSDDEDAAPSVSEADSSPVPAGQGSLAVEPLEEKRCLLCGEDLKCLDDGMECLFDDCMSECPDYVPEGGTACGRCGTDGVCSHDGEYCRMNDHVDECPLYTVPDGETEEAPLVEEPPQSLRDSSPMRGTGEPLGCGHLWNGMCLDTEPMVKCDSVEACRIREELEKLKEEEPEEDGRLQVVYLPVGLIDHHPDNPRKRIGDVTELAESIKAEGIQQPLTVVAGENGRYRAVIGHRRLEAAKKAGLKTVPAFVREMSRREQLRTMLTENGQREDLTPLEEADGFQQLMLELPEQTVANLARETGFGETTIRRRMNLLKLDREKVERGQERGASLRDYERLNAIKDPERRNKVLEEIGTDDFADALEEALDEENRERNRDRLMEGLRKQGARETTWADYCAVSQNVDTLERIYSYRWRDGEAVPKLEPGRELKYTEASECIYVYADKKPVQAAPGADEAAARKAEHERKRLKLCEELGTLCKEINDMAETFRADREEFVGSYDSWATGREEIMAFAVGVLLQQFYSYQKDKAVKLCNWLEIPMKGDKPDPARLRQVLGACPEKVLLYTAYLSIEGKLRSYSSSRADYNVNANYPVAEKNEGLDALYRGLEELGYRMSSGEKQWQKGNCPQYALATRLIREWKDEK